MIITLKELNVDKATIIDKIMTRFNLNLNVAQGYVEANW
jgi:predicted transcriptional regulator